MPFSRSVSIRFALDLTTCLKHCQVECFYGEFPVLHKNVSRKDNIRKDILIHQIENSKQLLNF